MDASGVALPREIQELCEKRGSLEVVGGPGAGKTVFCLTLLALLAGKGRRVSYMSTRIPMKMVFARFPICKEIKGGTFVDITNAGPAGGENGVEQLEVGDMADFAVLMTERAEKDLVMAIDPWEGLAEKDGRPSVEVERAMAEVMNQMGCTVILAREKGEPGPLQHSVDAQITLESVEVEGEPVRRMRIEKMRGFQLAERDHLYTLEGGRFAVTDAPGFSCGRFELSVAGYPKPLPETRDRFATGIQELDSMFGGGFPRGSYVTIEVDRETPSSVLETLCYPLVADFLLKGRGVMVIPAGTRDAAAELMIVQRMFDESRWQEVRQRFLANQLRIAELGACEPSDPHCSVVAPGEDISEDHKSWLALRRALGEAGRSPVLSIVSYDTIESMYGRKASLKVAGSDASQVRRDKGLHISIVFRDLAVRKRLMALSDCYLKARLINNTVLLWGTKPKMRPHALWVEDPGSFQRLRLIAMT